MIADITTVAMILKREIYTGVAEQLVRTVVSHRNKKEVDRPADERIRVENAFPVIIDRETWEATQEVNRLGTEKCGARSKPRKSMYSGLLICSDCGVTLSYWNPTKNYKDGKRVGYANFLCRTYQSTGGMDCSKHIISEAALKKIILSDIRYMAEQITLDEDAMRDSLIRRLTGGISVSRAEAAKECKRLRRDLHSLEFAISQLYENWAGGSISEDSFTEAIQTYESERQEKLQRLILLEQSEQEVSEKISDVSRWMQAIRSHSNVEDIDRELLDGLVEKIEIGRCDSVRGNDSQEIKIYLYQYKSVKLLYFINQSFNIPLRFRLVPFIE
jgi:hypothetical protein